MDIFHCEIRVGIEVEGWLLVSFLLGTLETISTKVTEVFYEANYL